jgi:release factor glutamine methyltransferase
LKDVFDIVVFDGVYPPSEDTYILVDSVTIKPDDVVLDVGCGAGLATLIAASTAWQVVSVDISLKAVKNTQENLRRNNLGTNVSMDQALVGGVSGIELTRRFIVDLQYHLIKGGCIYIVASSLANIGRIKSILRENNFEVRVEKEDSMFFERIQLLKGVWQGHKETVL